LSAAGVGRGDRGVHRGGRTRAQPAGPRRGRGEQPLAGDGGALPGIARDAAGGELGWCLSDDHEVIEAMRMLMKNCRRLARGLAVRLALGLATVSAGLPAVAEESAGSGLTAGEVAGAVMLRGEGVGGLARVRAGMRLPDGN